MIKSKCINRLLTALCIVCIAIVAVAFLPSGNTVEADNVSISNGDFSSFSDSDFTPTNWTKSGDNNSEIFSGVYDGKAGFEKHGFENSGLLVHDNAYKEFLVFNSKSFSAYTAYSSSDITLSASSYYQFTVKAKADVSVDNAYFSITGLDEDISLPIVNDGIWATYKIYLATDFDTSDIVKITLSLGKDESKAKGWAMFDDVSVESLTAYDYSAIVESDNILVKDVTTPYVSGLIENGDFTVLDYENWTVGGDKNNASVSVIPATYTEKPGQEETVVAPNFDGSANNVLRIASTDENGGYLTLTSNEFTVKTDEFYRISYFVMDEGNTSSTGVGATAKLYYKYATSPEDFKYVNVNNIQTSIANDSHFGWTERDFYVKGSSFDNVVVKIEFALGSESSPTVGGILIDDVRVQKLTAEKYADVAPDSSLVANADGDISDDTGVTNGSFMSYTIEDGKRIPSGWTQITAGSGDVASFGYSDTAVNTDNAEYKVVNSSEEPTANIGKYELALKMSSSTETAFGMRSSEITVSAEKYQLVTVSLSGLDVTGYGAGIVIRRSNGAIVAKAENVTLAGDYNFCIKGDASADTGVYAEVWLGLFDRNKNLDKLAAGTIYVNQVTTAESSETVYNAYASSTSNKEYAASVEFAESWWAYDKDDENNALYNWNVEKTVSDAKVEFVATQLNGEDVIKYSNLSPNASAIILTPAVSVTASTYYKITVQLKIEGSLDDIDTNLENYKGAWAGIITGSDTYATTKYTVKDIKETTLKTDKTNYVTLEFFVKGGDSDTSVSLFVGLGEDIAVADSEDKIPYTQGTVYIKGIAFEASSTTEYTDAKNDLKETQVLVNLSDSDEEETDEDTTTATTGMSSETLWLMLGSIIFALALIAVIIVFLVKRYAKKHPQPVKAKGRPSYDRANVAANAGKTPNIDKKSGAVEIDANIDRFSDETATEETATEETATEETATEETATEETATEETENIDKQE